MTKPKKRIKQAIRHVPNIIERFIYPITKFWKIGFWQKLTITLTVLILAIVSAAYGISYWFLAKHRHEPLSLGVTFIPNYAKFFDLDPQETMQAIIDDLGVKRFRLVSYWKDIEKAPGAYDFSELDWQFAMAEKAGAKVSLSLGLRQPRWPECHEPAWAKQLPKSQWYPKLKEFMTATVERYKNSPSLISYQVENEYFMTIFGECSDFDRQRFIEETALVRQLDPNKPIVITRSNNWGGIPINEPTPDLYGVAVYKRVFDYSVFHRYFEYPYPPWFYGFLGGLGEMVKGKPLMIHELQAEPWMPNGFQINDLADIPEQNKSMNADRLKKRFQYGIDTGMRAIDAWGVEWWYWRKVKANDSSLWDVARETFKNN